MQDLLRSSLNFLSTPNASSRQGRQKTYFHPISLKAFSASLYDRNELEEGNKILLPQSVLSDLSYFRIPYPMIFSLQNATLGLSTNVGVLEFTAEPGICIVPLWLFKSLNLIEGDEVNLQILSHVPKGKYVKIQPHKTEFIDLPNPRAVLETQFTKFVCLTTGDTISIKVLDKFYELNILDVEPKSESNCICLIETDVEIDFAQSLDYDEVASIPIKKETFVRLNEEEEKKNEVGIFKGKAIRINGNNVDPSKLVEPKKQQGGINEEWDPRKHRITYGVKGGKFHTLSSDQFKGTGTTIGGSERPTLSSLTKQNSKSGDTKEKEPVSQSTQKNPVKIMEAEQNPSKSSADTINTNNKIIQPEATKNTSITTNTSKPPEARPQTGSRPQTGARPTSGYNYKDLATNSYRGIIDSKNTPGLTEATTAITTNIGQISDIQIGKPAESLASKNLPSQGNTKYPSEMKQQVSGKTKSGIQNDYFADAKNLNTAIDNTNYKPSYSGDSNPTSDLGTKISSNYTRTGNSSNTQKTGNAIPTSTNYSNNSMGVDRPPYSKPYEPSGKITHGITGNTAIGTRSGQPYDNRAGNIGDYTNNLGSLNNPSSYYESNAGKGLGSNIPLKSGIGAGNGTTDLMSNYTNKTSNMRDPKNALTKPSNYTNINYEPSGSKPIEIISNSRPGVKITDISSQYSYNPEISQPSYGSGLNSNLQGKSYGEDPTKTSYRIQYTGVTDKKSNIGTKDSAGASDIRGISGTNYYPSASNNRGTTPTGNKAPNTGGINQYNRNSQNSRGGNR